jgi:hypothetical protein
VLLLYVNVIFHFFLNIIWINGIKVIFSCCFTMHVPMRSMYKKLDLNITKALYDLPHWPKMPHTTDKKKDDEVRDHIKLFL